MLPRIEPQEGFLPCFVEEGPTASNDLQAQLLVRCWVAHLWLIFGCNLIQWENLEFVGTELSGRPRDRSAGAPTDPDVQDSRIRLFESSSR